MEVRYVMPYDGKREFPGLGSLWNGWTIIVRQGSGRLPIKPRLYARNGPVGKLPHLHLHFHFHFHLQYL